MAIFKFRVITKDQDDFFRDIVIHSEKTLHDFHQIIIQSIDSMTCTNSSFYLCDEKWHKTKHVDFSDTPCNSYISSELTPDTSLNELIKFPNQKLIYICNQHNIAFYIRLTDILPFCKENSDTRCVAGRGSITVKETSTINR